MFVWDRQNEGTETASCWMRVVQSDTGGGYGAVHIPRVGEEVLIGYIGGDCDRPIVMHRVYNGATRPQWHSDGILSGFRSKEYAGRGTTRWCSTTRPARTVHACSAVARIRCCISAT